MKYDYNNYSEITFETWREKAACAAFDVNPKLFFPRRASDNNMKKATAICQSCDVRLQCLQHAKENNYTNGVWGGELFSKGVKE